MLHEVNEAKQKKSAIHQWPLIPSLRRLRFMYCFTLPTGLNRVDLNCPYC